MSMIYSCTGIIGRRQEALVTESDAGSRTNVRRGQTSGRPEFDRRLGQRQEETEHQSGIRLDQRPAGQNRPAERRSSFR